MVSLTKRLQFLWFTQLADWTGARVLFFHIFRITKKYNCNLVATDIILDKCIISKVFMVNEILSSYSKFSFGTIANK